MGRVAAFAVLVALLASSGCGTMLNLQHNERRVYGGVRLDAQHTADCLEDSGICVMPGDSDKMSPGDRMEGAACFILDLPFSAIADTLTLPVTIPAAIKASGQLSKSADDPGPPQGASEPPGATAPAPDADR